MVDDPKADTVPVEIHPWPAASPAEVNEQVGGKDAEEGLVIQQGLRGVTGRRWRW